MELHCEICDKNLDDSEAFMHHKTILCDACLSRITPTIRTARPPGRNDECPCGSGLKYKKCCNINVNDKINKSSTEN